MTNDFELDSDQGSLEPENQKTSAIKGIGKELLKIPRKIRIVITIFLVTALIIFALVALKPEAEKRPIPETVVSVNTIQVAPSSYPIVVNANGTVEAETRGDLVAQIRGEIVSVSESFKTGGTFKKGDVLIQIDPRDYQADLSRSMASMSQADAAYRQEQANAKQAKLDWKRLGNTSPAPDLVLRKPQLTAAKAQFDSAKAAQETAQLNLERTTLTAPYDGRIIQRRAVLGQYVSVGTPVAEVFATDGVEVRLPISQEEFNQLGLNDFSTDKPDSNHFNVVISTSIGNADYHWDAEITRTDSTFDINTRQIDVIAEVSDPFAKGSQQPALRIGQFVTARVQGRTVENIIVVPNKSIREGRYVYVVRDGKLAKQTINIIWQDDESALVGSGDGLSNGELVVTTSLNSTLAGASAKLSNSGQTEPAAEQESTAEAIEPDNSAIESETVTSKEPEIDSDPVAVDNIEENTTVENTVIENTTEESVVEEKAVEESAIEVNSVKTNIDVEHAPSSTTPESTPNNIQASPETAQSQTNATAATE